MGYPMTTKNSDESAENKIQNFFFKTLFNLFPIEIFKKDLRKKRSKKKISLQKC